jgi:hypothetical protein
MKSSATGFDRQPNRFAKYASKTFRLLTMATGLHTDERCLDLSEQDRVVCAAPRCFAGSFAVDRRPGSSS